MAQDTNKIVGTSANDEISGTSGRDTIIGHAGDDIITGGAGDDLLFGGAGNDTFVFEPGHGNDAIWAFEADDDIIDLSSFGIELTWDSLQDNFSTGYNFLFGNYVELDLSEFGGGTIQIWGVSSIDQLSEDMFVLPGTPLTLTGTDGSDTLDGNAGGDTISGGGGTDYLTGYEGADKIDGGAGDDFIVGGQGDDIITGGAGDDTLYGDGLRSDGYTSDGTFTGETDFDTFVFSPGSGHDTIEDFNNGEDLIDLTDFGGISGFQDINASQVGNSVVIKFEGNKSDDWSITLSNFDLNDLDSSDFIFQDAATDAI